MKRLAQMLIPLMLLGCCSGCLFTGKMWQQACSRTLAYPDVAGSLAGANGRNEALLARYSVEGGDSDRDLYVLVSLEADGTAVEPFAYGLSGRDPKPAPESVPEPQRRQVQDVVVSPADFAAGNAAYRSARFRPLNHLPGGISATPVRFATDGDP